MLIVVGRNVETKDTVMATLISKEHILKILPNPPLPIIPCPFTNINRIDLINPNTPSSETESTHTRLEYVIASVNGIDLKGYSQTTKGALKTSITPLRCLPV